jgi:hypothetical protein
MQKNKIRPLAMLMFSVHFENLFVKVACFSKTCHLAKIETGFYLRRSHDQGDDIVRD